MVIGLGRGPPVQATRGPPPCCAATRTSATASACPSRPTSRSAAASRTARACRAVVAARPAGARQRVDVAVGRSSSRLHRGPTDCWTTTSSLQGRRPRASRASSAPTPNVARLDDPDVGRRPTSPRPRRGAQPPRARPRTSRARRAKPRRPRALHGAVAGCSDCAGGRAPGRPTAGRPSRPRRSADGRTRPRACGASRRPMGAAAPCGVTAAGHPGSVERALMTRGNDARATARPPMARCWAWWATAAPAVEHAGSATRCGRARRVQVGHYRAGQARRGPARRRWSGAPRRRRARARRRRSPGASRPRGPG